MIPDNIDMMTNFMLSILTMTLHIYMYVLYEYVEERIRRHYPVDMPSVCAKKRLRRKPYTIMQRYIRECGLNLGVSQESLRLKSSVLPLFVP
jgi:hypothetical protein